MHGQQNIKNIRVSTQFIRLREANVAGLSWIKFGVLQNAQYLFSHFVIPYVSHTLVTMVIIVTVLCEQHADTKE
jgi:hypothetical protein